MKRVLTFLAAAGCSAMALSDALADQPTLGGFPIREPGASRPGGSSSGPRPSAARNEVVVSQDSGSRVRSIATAMRLVKPGGTILIKGGTYNENIVVTKPVEIRGVAGDYGRKAVIRPSAAAPCVSIAPDSALAAVSISDLIFEFDASTPSGACVKVAGGTVTVSNSFIIPSNSEIPLRAAYGMGTNSLRPELIDHLSRPARDNDSPEDAAASRLEGYLAHHAQPVGADHPAWDVATGGSNVEALLHARNARGVGILTGPASGVLVTAGDVRLDGNVIIGARTAVNFISDNNAYIKGQLTNNVIMGNGAGIAAVGAAADLLVTRNTIRYNAGDGVKADVYDGVKIIANEITGNDNGVFLSARVRQATVNSNLIAQNISDAMRVSSGFFGTVAANTIADNGGCTMQFFSAEQKILNNADIKVRAFDSFTPVVAYENTNYAVDNAGDARPSKKRKKHRRNQDEDRSDLSLVACDAPL